MSTDAGKIMLLMTACVVLYLLVSFVSMVFRCYLEWKMRRLYDLNAKVNCLHDEEANFSKFYREFSALDATGRKNWLKEFRANGGSSHYIRPAEGNLETRS